MFRHLDFFHILLRHSLILKWIKVFSPHQSTHNTPQSQCKNRFLDISANNKNDITIYVSIQNLYSIHFWSTFDRDYSLESSRVWRYKLGTPVFGEFLPFLSADPLKLCQVGWGALLHSYFQVLPEMFDWVQVRALAGPLKDIQRLVLKPFLRCLGCVLRIIVLLEGEPSPQSVK